MEIWPPGRWRRESKAKPAIEVITGSDAEKPAIPGFVGHLNPNIDSQGYDLLFHHDQIRKRSLSFDKTPPEPLCLN